MNYELSSPDKLFFPKEKITKEDLLEYYVGFSSKILPLVKDRPITLHRFPNGINKAGFIQKDIKHKLPAKVKSCLVSKQNQEDICMLLCNNVEALVYLVNQGCITMHMTLSKKAKLYQPDRLIFDLDPPSSNFNRVKEAAFELKELLEKDYQLKSYPMLTGSKGLHMIIPIKPKYEFDLVREFAKSIAFKLCEQSPKKYTLEIRKNKRGGKIFIDYLRNSFAQTSVAPYSVRALPQAPLAMPISWETLKKSSIHSQSYLFKDWKKYKRLGLPWKNFSATSYSLKIT